MTVLVMGAGLMGVTTAYALSQRGYDVTVIDKASTAATATSYANGGQLSYTHVDPLANCAILAKLPSIVLGLDSSIGFKPTLDVDLLSWGLKFLKNCNDRKELFNIKNILRLGLLSRQALHRINEAVPLQFNYRQNGKLAFYTDDKLFAKAAKNVVIKNKLGSPQKILSGAECLALDPILENSALNIAGGIHSNIDESGDSYEFSQQLANYCVGLGSVTFEYNCEAQSLLTEGNNIVAANTNKGTISADKIIMCMGIESVPICKSIGLDLPIYPLKGYSLTLPIKRAPELSITDVQSKMVYCRLGDQLRIAGIAEMNGKDLNINPSKVQQLLAKAKSRLPQAGDYEQVIHQWAGLRPVTPDSAPILGATPYANFYLNVGQGMLGWTLACGSAEIVADMINGKEPEISLEGLTYQRFA